MAVSSANRCPGITVVSEREYKGGLRTQPCGIPVLRTNVEEKWLPILTILCPVGQEVINPAADGVFQIQTGELQDQGNIPSKHVTM